MKETRILKIKEHDRITNVPSDDPKFAYSYNEKRDSYELADRYYQELKNHLLRQDENEKNRDEPNGNIVKFVKLRNHARFGEILQIQNYVGIIELSDGFQIQILPKIDLGKVSEREENDSLEHILLRMLGYLKDFPATLSDTADLDTQRTSLYEVFIQLYLNKVASLFQHGLRYKYVSKEESIPSFKGRIDVLKQLRFNYVTQQRVFVIHDEYMPDRPENRLIKSALLYLSKKSESSDNSKRSRRLLSAFENVPLSKDYLKDYSSVVYDRFTDVYWDIIEWSIAFLLGKSFVTKKGETTADSLLFPMEKIFEEYVARKLLRCMKASSFYPEWKLMIQSEKHRKYLFDEPKDFKIIPDIRIYRTITLPEGQSREESIILDTKWKKLDPTGIKMPHYGISQNDMYQMYAYAKRYNARHVWLIYPYSNGDERIEGKEYKTKYDYPIELKLETNVTVHLFFINLIQLAESKLHSTTSNTPSVEEQLASLLNASISTEKTVEYRYKEVENDID